MAESGNKEDGAHCSGRKCGGCKFLAGLIVGLLLAGTALGIFMVGRAHGCHKQGMCPFMSMQDHGMPTVQGKSAK